MIIERSSWDIYTGKYTYVDLAVSINDHSNLIALVGKKKKMGAQMHLTFYIVDTPES